MKKKDPQEDEGTPFHPSSSPLAASWHSVRLGPALSPQQIGKYDRIADIKPTPAAVNNDKCTWGRRSRVAASLAANGSVIIASAAYVFDKVPNFPEGCRVLSY